jgi:hypothetical protein
MACRFLKKNFMNKIFKSQLVELILSGIPTTGNPSTKLQFLDQPYLRNKKIFGIELITKADMSGNTSPTGRQIFDISAANTTGGAAYLTLYLNDVQNPNNVGEWIQNVPFPRLHNLQQVPAAANSGDTFSRKGWDMAGQVIYWEKCYCTFPVAIANTVDLSILLNVYFAD